MKITLSQLLNMTKAQQKKWMDSEGFTYELICNQIDLCEEQQIRDDFREQCQVNIQKSAMVMAQYITNHFTSDLDITEAKKAEVTTLLCNTLLDLTQNVIQKWEHVLTIEEMQSILQLHQNTALIEKSTQLNAEITAEIQAVCSDPEFSNRIEQQVLDCLEA